MLKRKNACVIIKIYRKLIPLASRIPISVDSEEVPVMRKAISLLLTLAMVLTMLPATALGGNFARTRTWSDDLFTDVSRENWFYDTVKAAYELELMNGSTGGKFMPEGNITLAETLAVAARIHAGYHGGDGTFVQGDPWYQVYVDYALVNGLLTEIPDDYGRAATRLEFAQILSRTLPDAELHAINRVDDGAIPDVADDAAVYRLYRAGVLTGSDKRGAFLPDTSIARSEVAAIVARMAEPSLRRVVTLTVEKPGETAGVYVPEPSAPAQPDVDPPQQPETGAAGGETVPFDVAHPDLFASDAVNYSGEQILIKVAAALTGEQQSALREAGVTGLEHIMDTADAVWYKAYVSGDVNAVMSAVRELSFVLVAEYDYTYASGSIIECGPGDMEEFGGNDLVDQQWYLRTRGIQNSLQHLRKPHRRPHYDEDRGHAGVEEDAEETAGVEAGDGILVAVIDTGVDYTHEDLRGNIFVNTAEIPDNGLDDDKNGYIDDYYGWNAVANKGSGMDDHGHGTHVAGIIAASNNEMGIVGIAYNATILPIKAGMASGFFNSSDIARAIVYAGEMGADVINMSFGGIASGGLVEDALEEAYTRSILVAAAGNNGAANESCVMNPGLPTYPAAYPYVLGVMSVNENGIESDFSNWDAYPFNSIEYELYAPGEAMISTIPGNRYAAWSGTSMAAPVVSAMAALLRSEFRDSSIYPTKFIYGQLCGTSELMAQCVDREGHAGHRTGPIVDIYKALTVMPSPDVGVTDYTVFDTENLGAGNNGDGVIDAGETIAFGVTLRNKWGKSTNTVVTVDTRSQGGVSDPYITIEDPSVTIGQVGTYSTNDCGRVMENDAFVAWENPIYITVAEDCPNDYIFNLNVTVTCENGLDSDDTATYESETTVSLTVRNGVVLSGLIKEDMVLTKDNYYVIPDATMIMEGVTVTVEEGTQIQFWSGDAEDPYADSYIASLRVEGTLICEGTPEEPVQMFPSDLMGKYRVEITTVNGGSVRLFHTDVVNPCLDITYAEGCEFSQKYPGQDVWYRYLMSGLVRQQETGTSVSAYELRECVFNRISGHYYGCGDYGAHYNCAFIDSFVDLNGTYENCLFYGNNSYMGRDIGRVSELDVGPIVGTMTETTSFDRIFADPDTGNTYLVLDSGDAKAAALYAQQLGGALASINTESEFALLKRKLYGNWDYAIGLSVDYASGELSDRWADGTEVGEFLPVTMDPETLNCVVYSHRNHNITTVSSPGKCLIEIPASKVEEIGLNCYAVLLETEDQWQIETTVRPSGVEDDKLIFKSTNEEVATVDQNGLVTAVGQGSAEIRVYASDMSVYTWLDVYVITKVDLVSIDLGEDFTLNKGESRQLKPALNPANTTKWDVVYESSDEDVAEVDEEGLVTAVGRGEAEITVTNPETGVSDTVAVTVYVPVSEVSFKEPMYVTSGETEDSVEDLDVTVLPLDANDPELVWESSNPEVVSVDEEGNLVKGEEGTAALRATSVSSGLYAEVTVCVVTMDPEVTVVQMGSYGSTTTSHPGPYVMALLSDGTLWQWGSNIVFPERMHYRKSDDYEMVGGKYVYAEHLFPDNIVQFAVEFFPLSGGWSYYHLFLLDEDGVLNEYHAYQSAQADWYLENDVLGGQPVPGVVQVEADNVARYSDSMFYLKKDGTVWGVGSNQYGELGTGDTATQYEAVQMQGLDGIKIVDVVYTYNTTYLLAENGDLYRVGRKSEGLLPERFDEGVVDIFAQAIDSNSDGDNLAILYEDGTIFGRNARQEILGKAMFYGISQTFYIDGDGTVYGKGINYYGNLGDGTTETRNDYVPMETVENAEDILIVGNTTYVQTEDGKFYGVGYNENGEVSGMLTGTQTTPRQIFFGLAPEETGPALETDGGHNFTVNEEDGSYILDEPVIRLDFDQSLVRGGRYASISMKDSAGQQIGLNRTWKLDKFTVAAAGSFVAGETYTLTIPAAAFLNSFALANNEIVLTFVAGAGAVTPEDPDAGEKETPDEETEPDGEETPDEETEPVEIPAITGDEYNETVKNPDYTETGVALDLAYFQTQWDIYTATGINPVFCGNALVNRIDSEPVTRWLRLNGASSSEHIPVSVSGNWWGTTNETLIDAQILDFADSYAQVDLEEGEYLTEAPADVWPFVVDAWLETDEGRVDTIGNETVTFCVKFNRPMDTELPLDVRFGSAYPYGDYQVEGEWITETLWKGTTTLTTLIEAGYQYWTVDDACAADDPSLTLYKDWGRFPFEIDTADALAMILQGVAGDEGVALEWTQDDYSENTLAGYNVYRSEQDDGYYQKLNAAIIPTGTKEYFDDTVEPGKVYYYIFTAVLTDFSESAPSGKIRIVSKDTMAPTLYHTPVYSAYENRNVVINATASDNVGLSAVMLHYRIVGAESWSNVEMTKLNDRYSAYISGSVTAEALGKNIEYYVTAFDGVSTVSRGSEAEPYIIVVQADPGEQMLGDVDGNGRVTLLDALRVLRAINGKVILSEEEFKRADLDGNGTLTAAEALLILKYANGEIGSLQG